MKKYRVTKADGSFCESLEVPNEPHEVIEIIEPTIEDVNAEKTIQYMKRLQAVVVHLANRAEALAIGKEGSVEYIAAQRKFYENKYDYSIGNFIDLETENRLLIEAQKFNVSYGLNLTVSDFKQLIIYRFDDSKLFYQKYMMMLETGRTAIQTLIENCDWDKVEQAFILAEGLNDLALAKTTMDNILNL